MMKKTIVWIGIGIMLAGGIYAYGAGEKAAVEDLLPVTVAQEPQNPNRDSGLKEAEDREVREKGVEPIGQIHKEKSGNHEDAEPEDSSVEIDPDQHADKEPQIENEGEADAAQEPAVSEAKPVSDPENEAGVGPEEEANLEEIQAEPAIPAEPVAEQPPLEAADPIQVEEPAQPDPAPVAASETLPATRPFSEIFIGEKIHAKENPMTAQEFEAVLLRMCETDTFSYSMEYRGISFDELLGEKTQEAIAEAFDSVFHRYPEYMSFTNNMSYKAKGGSNQVILTLTLSSDTGMNAAEIKGHRQAFFEEAMAIIRELEGAGLLYDGQSDKDKARLLFDWVVQHAEYDNHFYPESYTGYGVFANGLGVCQGYTAAYNALCKCAGLWVEGIGGVADGQDHIWTKALFAGDDVYIDATWGDSYVNSDKSNYDFFFVNGAALAATHTW